MKTRPTPVRTLEVEIVAASAERLARERLQLPIDATVRDALSASTLTLAQRVSDAMRNVNHIADSNVGIWGRRVLLETSLTDGDRIELYRELIADAKTARLKRASEQGYRWQGRTRRAARNT